MDTIADVNWSEFLGQHNLRFDGLPADWREAPHFGNAMVGSMLYFEGGKLRLEIYRADVRDHRDESFGWSAYRAPHFRIGYFELESKGRPLDVQWEKDLWNAELTGSIRTEAGNIEITHFTHSEDMAIVTELRESEGEGDLSWTWHAYEANTTRAGYPTNQEELETFARRYGEHYLETLKPKEDNPPGQELSVNGINLWQQDLLYGGQHATTWKEYSQDSYHNLTVTITNSYPDATATEQALSNIEAYIAEDWDVWVESHRSWWHNYYLQSYLSIPDKQLEALYWQTIYRYGCCSRGGRFYMDVTGIWFQGLQWPYTCHDWNSQSAHWAVYTANRLDQGIEIVNRLRDNQKNLIDAVYPEEWREDSAYLHLSTPSDLSGSRISDMRYYNCVGNLPWLLNNAWLQYRYSMDDAILKDTLFPLLRRAVNLYRHLLEEDEQGTLHLSPTYSPETAEYRNSNFDLALLKWGCHILVQSCNILNIDDPLIPEWKKIINDLIDFPAGDDGFMLAEDVPTPKGHRHLSHLMMIYPLYLVNPDQKENLELLERSYEVAHANDGSDHGDICKLHAMVQTHATVIGTLLEKGDMALQGLSKLQSELHPNGLWGCEGPLCIESTLGIANTLQDMVLQSWQDPSDHGPVTIRVFPALPSDWKDIEFHQLRTQGAFLVSALRKDGITQWIEIDSLAEDTCYLKADLQTFSVDGPADVSTSSDSGLLMIRFGEKGRVRLAGE